MKLEEYLEFFKKYYYKKLFNLNELHSLTNIPKNILTVELNRLVEKKIVERVTKGVYVNPFNKPSIEEISMFLKFPSYISMEYALFVQNIMSQAVYTLTLITTLTPYEYQFKNYSLEYHQIKKEFFFGYYESSPKIYMAYPEKALLDIIYIRYKKGKMDKYIFESFLSDLYLSELNEKKVVEYAEKMGFKKGSNSPLSLVSPFIGRYL
ncbi:MAG TPA: hypothetical protein PK151_07405 [Caldisericia bacterium]|nr:hypothetical protein [Caldisericia bacterium]